jgi:thiol-disulfide isomerase/thioredoxin
LKHRPQPPYSIVGLAFFDSPSVLHYLTFSVITNRFGRDKNHHRKESSKVRRRRRIGDKGKFNTQKASTVPCKTAQEKSSSIYTNDKVLVGKMAYLLPHLHSGWEVDQAIMTEEDRVVVIRFGHDTDPTCMVQDEILMSIAEKVKNFAVIYLVDITEVPDFNNMYELYDE